MSARRCACVAVLLPLGCDGFSVAPPGVADDEVAPSVQRDFYTYVDPSGRPVYVGDESLIPPAHRDAAQRVDLGGVSLNLELGNEWRDAIHAEHERLSRTEHCVEATELAHAGLPAVALEQDTPLLGIGAVVLLLLVTAPFVSRRVGAGRWARTLVFVIPVLLFLGILATVLTRASSTLNGLRETATLCDPEHVEGSDADALTRRIDVVGRLTEQVREASRVRGRAIDQQLEDDTR